jgi:hypothetical protein
MTPHEALRLLDGAQRQLLAANDALSPPEAPSRTRRDAVRDAIVTVSWRLNELEQALRYEQARQNFKTQRIRTMTEQATAKQLLDFMTDSLRSAILQQLENYDDLPPTLQALLPTKTPLEQEMDGYLQAWLQQRAADKRSNAILARQVA